MSGNHEVSHVETSLLDKIPVDYRIMVAGGLSGSLAKSVTAPLSRVVILFQVILGTHRLTCYSIGSISSLLSKVHGMVSSKKENLVYAQGIRQAFQKIISREGVFALWKGNGTNIIHRFPYSAINFWVYENSKVFLSRLANSTSIHREDFWVRLLAGAIAGATAVTLCYPLDLVRTRLATQRDNAYTGIIDCLSKIVKSEGIIGLYSGLNATLMSAAPNIALSYASYNEIKDFLVRSKLLVNSNDESQLNMYGCLVAGGISGTGCALLTFPFDVIKRRMQIANRFPASELASKQGILSEMRRIIAAEGVRGLYRGLIPELLKVIPVVAISFSMYDYLMKRNKLDADNSKA